jgi:hypothetical protein
MIRQAHQPPSAHQQTSKFRCPNLPGFKNGLILDFIEFSFHSDIGVQSEALLVLPRRSPSQLSETEQSFALNSVMTYQGLAPL